MSQHSGPVSLLSEHPASPALLTNPGPQRDFCSALGSNQGMGLCQLVAPLNRHTGCLLLHPDEHAQILRRLLLHRLSMVKKLAFGLARPIHSSRIG